MNRYYSARLIFRVVLLVATLVPWVCAAGSDPEIAAVKGQEEQEGYRDVTAVDGDFIAVGTGGKIDLITATGSIIPMGNDSDADLNTVITEGPAIIAAGSKGTILLSSDRTTFRKIETGTVKNIRSITSYNGLIIALTEDNSILVPGDNNKWIEVNLPLKGNIVALSAGLPGCAGATDRGEIIRSEDAINWEIFDYNENYAGFGRPCIFTDIAVSDNRIAVAGYHSDNTPVVLFSTLGNVWMERTLNYTDDDGIIGLLKGIPERITYDIKGDQFFIVAPGGEIMSLPQCSKCNTLIRGGIQNPEGLSAGPRSMIVAGDGFSYERIQIRDY